MTLRVTKARKPVANVEPPLQVYAFSGPKGSFRYETTSLMEALRLYERDTGDRLLDVKEVPNDGEDQPHAP